MDEQQFAQRLLALLNRNPNINLAEYFRNDPAFQEFVRITQFRHYRADEPQQQLLKSIIPALIESVAIEVPGLIATKEIFIPALIQKPGEQLAYLYTVEEVVGGVTKKAFYIGGMTEDPIELPKEMAAGPGWEFDAHIHIKSFNNALVDILYYYLPPWNSNFSNWEEVSNGRTNREQTAYIAQWDTVSKTITQVRDDRTIALIYIGKGIWHSTLIFPKVSTWPVYRTEIYRFIGYSGSYSAATMTPISLYLDRERGLVQTALTWSHTNPQLPSGYNMNWDGGGMPLDWTQSNFSHQFRWHDSIVYGRTPRERERWGEQTYYGVYLLCNNSQKSLLTKYENNIYYEGGLAARQTISFDLILRNGEQTQTFAGDRRTNVDQNGVIQNVWYGEDQTFHIIKPNGSKVGIVNENWFSTNFDGSWGYYRAFYPDVGNSIFSPNAERPMNNGNRNMNTLSSKRHVGWFGNHIFLHDPSRPNALNKLLTEKAKKDVELTKYKINPYIDSTGAERLSLVEETTKKLIPTYTLLRVPTLIVHDMVYFE